MPYPFKSFLDKFLTMLNTRLYSLPMCLGYKAEFPNCQRFPKKGGKKKKKKEFHRAMS